MRPFHKILLSLLPWQPRYTSQHIGKKNRVGQIGQDFESTGHADDGSDNEGRHVAVKDRSWMGLFVCLFMTMVMMGGTTCVVWRIMKREKRISGLGWWVRVRRS